MVKIKDLPDISRFVRRGDPLLIHNTVLLLIGEESVEVSGPVISIKSQVLQDIVGSQKEVYLDEFVDEVEGVRDAVELLYGGDVAITSHNVRTVLKFSVVYEIRDLYELVVGWVGENIGGLNLYEMIEFGVMIERLGQGKDDVLKICVKFICENVKDDLCEFHFQKERRHSVNCVKFLIQEEILAYTLPILTNWVSSDSDINVVIGELEVKGLAEYLGGYDGSLALLDKMVEKAEGNETSKKVIQLQKMRSKRRKIVCVVQKKDLTTLLAEDYRSFTVQQIMNLEDSYQLEHYEFVEIVVAWMGNNLRITQQEMGKLWEKIRPLDLIEGLLCPVRRSIIGIYHHIINVPEMLDQDPGFRYKYDGLACYTFSYLSDLSSLEVTWTCKNECCDYWYCSFKANVRISDKIPCYDIVSITMNNEPAPVTHHLVDHAFLVKWESTIFAAEKFHQSLLTNDYSTVVDVIKEGNFTRFRHFVIGLRLMYKCPHNSPSRSSNSAQGASSLCKTSKPLTRDQIYGIL